MRLYKILCFVLVVAALVGCSSAGNQGQNQPPAADNPTDTLTATAEATVTHTPSPLPPTATATATKPATPTVTPEPVPYGPSFPENVNPLTGLIASDTALLERRPMSIKIQMFPRSGRPPWGISKADIVYDYLQNDGLTRLNAIYYGTDAELVGPVRSGRLLDGHIVQMYKAVFAFGGAAQPVMNSYYYSDFSDRLIMEGANHCPPMCRIDPNGYNYLVVSDTVKLSEYATSLGIENGRQNLDGMQFFTQAPEGGEAGEQVFTRYSISAYSRWDYDPASGRYLRFQDTQEDSGSGEAFAPLLDRSTNEQVTADNVVVLFAVHNTNPPYSPKVIDIQLSGQGKAYAFRDGQAYEVLWNRPTPDAVLNLTFPDGSPYYYKPGTTWYQVVGQSTLPANPEAGAWRFNSVMP
jgi:hypothetical protein